MKNVLLMIFVFVFIVGCNDFQGQPKGVVKVKQFHYSNGGLKKEIPYNSSGQIHGIVREWLDDGRLFVEVEYKNGILDGFSTSYYDYTNGKKYKEMEYKGGILNGYDREWKVNGDLLFECEYKNSMKDGRCVEWYKHHNQIKMDSNYSMDKKNGI